MTEQGPGYAMISLDEIEPRQVDGIEPTLLSVGYELRPQQMRPNVWRFAAGESTADHRHAEQEELYAVLEGSFDATVEHDGDREEYDGDREEFVLDAGDYLVVEPPTWRQLTAAEESWLLVVGAPPVKDDEQRRDER